jgi:integrase/recombinase XerC
MEQTVFMLRLKQKLAEEDLAEATIKRTLIDAAQFGKWYRGTTGHDLDPDDLQVVNVDLAEFRGWLQRQDMKPSSVQRKFASLRKAFMLLSPERALRLRWPKLPTAQVTAPSGLSRNERNAILRACEQLSARDALVVKLGLFTGARSSSIADIRMSDIEVGQRSGSITFHGKGNREYKVPLNREVRDALARYLAVRPPVEHPYLLVQERWPYGKVSRWVLHDIAHRRLAGHLPPDVAKRMKGLHAFRHDLARRLLSGDEGRHAPIPVGDVAAILGHADVRTTAGIYARPSPEDMKRALDRIAGDEDEDG